MRSLVLVSSLTLMSVDVSPCWAERCTCTVRVFGVLRSWVSQTLRAFCPSREWRRYAAASASALGFIVCLCVSILAGGETLVLSCCSRNCVFFVL